MDEKAKSAAKINEEIKSLRDDLQRHILAFQYVESMIDQNLKEATDAGYRLGWWAGLMAAAERLGQLKMKMAAEKVLAMIDESQTSPMA
jgi:flagellar biosynthesis/type III secretory pathway protein FliH